MIFDHIIRHLDSLVEQRNPKHLIDRKYASKVRILDIGCGRGIALEDIAAYYGPLLNLRLEGESLHTPRYAEEFAKRNIFWREVPPLQRHNKTMYDLIMANNVIGYYYNPLGFLNFGREHLTADGIFIIDLIDFKNIVIIDKKHKMISDPQEYLFNAYKKMGWVIDLKSKSLVVKAYPHDELKLTSIPALKIPAPTDNVWKERRYMIVDK